MRKANEILDKFGVNRQKFGIFSRPKVETAFGDEQKPTFYTVSFIGHLGGYEVENEIDMFQIRFRHAQGQWLATFWRNNSCNSEEALTQKFQTLFNRFFAK